MEREKPIKEQVPRSSQAKEGRRLTRDDIRKIKNETFLIDMRNKIKKEKNK